MEGPAVEPAAGGPSADGRRVLADESDTAPIAPLFGVSKSAADRIICGQYGRGSALDGLVESGDELPMAPSA
jgi:hypothetical protein